MCTCLKVLLSDFFVSIAQYLMFPGLFDHGYVDVWRYAVFRMSSQGGNIDIFNAYYALLVLAKSQNTLN